MTTRVVDFKGSSYVLSNYVVTDVPCHYYHELSETESFSNFFS